MLISEELGITKNGVRVDFVNLGEGYFGDYDMEDPEDVNLLRFDVYHFEDGEWVAVDDSSYCTQIPAETQTENLYDLLQIIMDEVYEPVSSGQSVKRMCERLSWLDERGVY